MERFILSFGQDFIIVKFSILRYDIEEKRNDGFSYRRELITKGIMKYWLFFYLVDNKRVRDTSVLANGEFILGIIQNNHRTVVTVDSSVAWGTKDCDNTWKNINSLPLMQLIAIFLYFMAPDNAFYTISF
jgi:hypothetical protein